MEISELLKNKLNNVIDMTKQFNTAINKLDYSDNDGISECQTLLSNVLYRFNSFVTLCNELNQTQTIKDSTTNS